MTVTLMANRTFSLLCGDCDTAFITYDPNAERGHPVSLGDVVNDAARHAKECPFAEPDAVIGLVATCLAGIEAARDEDAALLMAAMDEEDDDA